MVVDLEADLLRKHGHQIERLSVSTSELKSAGLLKLAAAGLRTVWSSRGYSALRLAVARFQPDIIHVHNTFPLLSPSVFWAAEKSGVPVIQTLHNFRLTCANASLLRNQQPCQKCVGHLPLPGIIHRCYKDSFLASSAVVSMNVFHRLAGTSLKKVHAYICVSEFSKGILVRAGLPAERICVKPNFTFDPAPREIGSERLPQVVFAGKISREKGVHLLLEAWSKAELPGITLVMIGDGPDRAELQQRYASDSSIVWLGIQSRENVVATLARSRLLVLPSLLYENFPMVLVEAFSVGTPVIVPDHGPFPEFVAHGQDGLRFLPGNALSLAEALCTAHTTTKEVWSAWSTSVRRKYAERYSETQNYALLLAIYEQAIERCHRERPRNNATAAL